MKNRLNKLSLIILLALLFPVLGLPQERGEIFREAGEYIERIDKTIKVKEGGELTGISAEGPIYIESCNKT